MNTERATTGPKEMVEKLRVARLFSEVIVEWIMEMVIDIALMMAINILSDILNLSRYDFSI